MSIICLHKISSAAIQDALRFSNRWEVFDFLMEALNYGYVKGKLDEPASMLYVEDYASRDVCAEEIDIIRNKLDTL